MIAARDENGISRLKSSTSGSRGRLCASEGKKKWNFSLISGLINHQTISQSPSFPLSISLRFRQVSRLNSPFFRFYFLCELSFVVRTSVRTFLNFWHSSLLFNIFIDFFCCRDITWNCREKPPEKCFRFCRVGPVSFKDINVPAHPVPRGKHRNFLTKYNFWKIPSKNWKFPAWKMLENGHGRCLREPSLNRAWRKYRPTGIGRVRHSREFYLTCQTIS